MSLLPVIINALVPIAFVILLGFLAGHFGLFKAESGEVLANLGLTFCLPALLFNATATMTMAELHDWRFFLGLALGLLVIYFLALTISMGIFRKPVDASSLQALSSAFPSMALVGIPLLLALIGRSAVLSVAFANLVVSFVMMPVTLTLLEAGRPTEAGHTRSAVVWGCLLHAIKQPLVWAPIAGLAMAAAHIRLPEMAQRSFALIGEATSGVALFATGLLLSGQKLRISSAVALSVTLKNLAQPAVMWLIALLFGLTTLHRREMVLLGAVPTAVGPMMLATHYKVDLDESEATIFLSTVLSMGTLGAFIALTY